MRKSRRLLPRLLIFLPFWVAVGVGWWFREPLRTLWPRAKGEVEQVIQRQRSPQPDPKAYARLTSDLADWRNELAADYAKAWTKAQRAAIEQEARAVLEVALPGMMQCWLGTPYDFNGTASGPGQGKIACGYFVATVLRDAGFQVDRFRLAQQASENILRSFLPEKSCALTVGEEYAQFAARLENHEPGVYIVGLDTHVAFVVVTAKGFHFIHATGARPWCVVDQTRDQAQTLRNSSWRMLGNLTAETTVLRRWLRNEKIRVRGT